jgi:serine/threonine protein kinase
MARSESASDRKIAEGGMGVVYRARELELNRVVALKMIRAGELSGDSAVQRFRLEAEAAVTAVVNLQARGFAYVPAP